jgi:hypothetical protein
MHVVLKLLHKKHKKRLKKALVNTLWKTLKLNDNLRIINLI